MMMKAIDSMVYFKLTENVVVKKYLDKHSKTVKDILDTYGLLPFAAIGFTVIILILLLFKSLIIKNKKAFMIYQVLLNALMFNSVLRCLIQAYM